MSTNQYLKALRTCRSPEKAATYIRAFEATVSGYVGFGNKDTDIVANLRRAEQRAQSLERPFEDGDGNVIAKPWRQWLKEWGYI